MSSKPRAPTPVHAALVWLGALAAVVLASIGAVALAVAMRARGTSLAELRDPAQSPLLHSPGWFVFGALATQGTVALVLLLALWIGKYARPLVLPVRRVPGQTIAGALLVVFGIAPSAQAVGELTSRLLHVELKASLLVSAMAQKSGALEFGAMLFTLSVLPALVEESLFRGYMTAAFARRSFLVRLLIPSVLFGIFHLEPTQSAATVLLGMGFALARLLSGSLVPGMIAHGVYNATVLVVSRTLSDPDDHEIRLIPLLVGAVLFAAGLGLLRGATRPAAPPPSSSTKPG